MDQGRSGGAGQVPSPADDTTHSPSAPGARDRAHARDGHDPDDDRLGSVDDDAAVDRGRPIGFWLTLVDRLIDERFEAVLDEHGVTRRQWQLLNLLERGPAPTAALDASVAPFLDSATGETSADHLTELVESGWVSVATDALGDSSFTMTERGSTAHRRLVDVVTAIRDDTVRGVSPEEYATTVRVLRTAALNLGWTP